MTAVSHRLFVDLQALQSPAHADRGVARYVFEHARALLDRDAIGGLLLNPLLPFPRGLDDELATSPLLAWNTRSGVRRLLDSGDERPPAFLLNSPFEISNRVETDVSLPALDAGMPLIVTLYDLVPLVFADRYLHDPTYERRYRARLELLHQADLVLAISAHTRRDSMRLLGLDGAKVVDIGAGVSPYFRPALDDDPSSLLRSELPAIGDRFVSVIPGDDPRKNVLGLIDAWAKVSPACRRDHTLVLTCKVSDGTRQAWLARAAEAGLADGDVVITGWVTDEVKRALLQRCDLYVCPFLYEGSWLPTGEAMACGAPVVTSATTSVPEALDWPESTFDPEDPSAMAAVIERGLTDDAFVARLRRRAAERVPSLTWAAVGDRTIDALDRLPSPARRAHQRARLALVGPVPPTRSGIADYNARLLVALSREADVDVFTTSDRGGRPEVRGVRWFDPRALRETLSPTSYDAIVFTAGNSDDHHDLYELATELPGVLWLHDVRVPGLLITYARARAGDDDEAEAFLYEKLDAQYGPRRPPELVRTPNVAWTHWVEHGLGMAKELVDVARAVVVSSATAARLLQLDLGPDAPTAPVTVLPLGAPTPWGHDRSRAPVSAPSLVALGHLSPVNHAEAIVHAVAELRRRATPVRLAFVGPAPDDFRAHLTGVIERARVDDLVTIAGHVPDHEYRRWLETATLALQLRRSTNGESSASVLDCLAAGLPVLTNVAAARELPDGAVELMPYDVTAITLADRIAALLGEPARLKALSAAGRHAAAAWSIDDAAAALLSLVRRL